MSFLQKFDAYPRTLDDVRIKTYGGAIISILSAVIIVVLVISEFSYYKATELASELIVDTGRGQKMRINFDVLIHSVSCEFLTLDVMDVSGEHQSDIDHDVFKVRVDRDGNPLGKDPVKLAEPGEEEDSSKKLAPLPKGYCGSCYGAAAENECCNTCEEVRSAYRKMGWNINGLDSFEQCKREGVTEKIQNMGNEGCRIHGHVEVNKVAGNIHIAPGKSYQQHHMHVHDINALGNLAHLSTAHTINRLSFGTEFPDIVNPLDNHANTARWEPLMHQYFIKVVPTRFNYLNGTVLETNQFSVTKHERLIAPGMQGLPGVFFTFEISPMLVIHTQRTKSFLYFLTGVSAIVGGIFTVAGMFDSAVYSAEKTLKKKIELGKAN